jgi:hypothetical protein
LALTWQNWRLVLAAARLKSRLTRDKIPEQAAIHNKLSSGSRGARRLEKDSSYIAAGIMRVLGYNLRS